LPDQFPIISVSIEKTGQLTVAISLATAMASMALE
jgi:hypothetical protein